MIRRVLLAVNDSPAALAAARLAIGLASGWGATVRAVTVVSDHAISEQLRPRRPTGPEVDTVDERRARAANAVLRHVARLADTAAVPIETRQLDGEPAARILEQAGSWPAELIVLGRNDRPGSDRHGTGQLYVGSQTRHVLEFAEQPVLVVPPGAALDSGGRVSAP